jgi:Cu+-exporting ATPase
MCATAFIIAFDDQYQEHVFPVDSKDLRAGDLLLLQAGATIPADCKLLWGEVQVLEKGKDAALTWIPPQVVRGGGLVESGTAKAYVTVAGPEAIHAHTS